MLEFLKSVPKCWVLKTHEVSRRGIPDIILCLDGAFVALELKIEGGETDMLQQYELGAIRKAGGIAMAVTPKTFKKVFVSLGLINERKSP